MSKNVYSGRITHTVERARNAEKECWASGKGIVFSNYDFHTHHRWERPMVIAPNCYEDYDKITRPMVRPWGISSSTWKNQFHRTPLTQEILAVMGMDKDPYEQYVEDVERNGQGNYDPEEAVLKLEKTYNWMWNVWADNTYKQEK